ncbi:MAG: hypothetical protein KF878_34205 [Planctomycetes bacterium]|nr:hypothetical protein [Planctomycetota bacterium]MCW8141989.1 hypothetical protein [Planctomycetota bacterium]
MWIVRNALRATLSLRGLGVTIPSGQEFDLDGLGRDRVEASNQVQVAFEEGYLENVYKAPREGGVSHTSSGVAMAMGRGVSGEELDAFKRSFMSELREQLPQLANVANASHLEQMRQAISQDVQALVGEFKLLRDRFEFAKGRVREDPTLSDAEVKARLAFLEEQERELLKNFETVGRRIEQEQEDGDVMGKADLLSNL